ncbi:tetratricopeptide repeat protein 23-like [Polyodon spathula]|uniref:tetratricopeptide repeat protein 23-like n=1 Tax=Polyodon spathula TaxID=7913 RepID=UPI001B7E48D8|nr:tetratricopeptide repeat protein 23-like [Polyodon spathula]
MQTAPIRIPTGSWDISDLEVHRQEENSHSGSILTERSSQGNISTRSLQEALQNTWAHGPTPEEKLLIAQAMAEEFIQNKEVPRAMNELIRCVALSRLVYGDGHWRLAESIANVAHGYLKLQGLPAQALQHAESARDIMLGGVDFPGPEMEKKELLNTLITTYYSLGMAHLIQKNVQEAHRNLQKTEKIMEELQRLNRTEDRSQRVSEKDLAEALGRVSILQNKPASAVVFFEKAAAHVNANQGQDSPELIKIYQEMAKAEQMRVRHEEAIEHLLQAYSMAVALFKKDSTEAAQAALVLATGYVAAGKKEYNKAAEQYFNESISTYQSVLGPENPQTMYSVDGYSNWLIQTGRQEESYELLRSTLQSRKEAFGDYSDSMAETYSVMGSIALAGGEVKKAYKLLRKCLEIQMVLCGSQHKKTRRTQQMLDMLQKSPAVSTNNRATYNQN